MRSVETVYDNIQSFNFSFINFNASAAYPTSAAIPVNRRDRSFVETTIFFAKSRFLIKKAFKIQL